jgi:hypothetical protein
MKNTFNLLNEYFEQQFSEIIKLIVLDLVLIYVFIL